MHKFKKSSLYIFTIFILLIVSINISGCKEEKNEEEKKTKLNVFMDVNDKHSMNIIKYLIQEFENDNKDIEINFGSTLGAENDALEKINRGDQADIIFTYRNNMIELYKKGFITELSGLYKENKLNERYYDVVNSYGRIEDNYYGIGVIPYSIEFLYNKEALSRLNINYPNDIKAWGEIVKRMKTENVRIPVLLTDDIQTNLGLMSLVVSKEVNINELGKKYNTGREEYINIAGMQNSFDELNRLVKQNYFDYDTFEGGNENSINRFINGEIPLMLTISYFSSMFNKAEIGLVEDINIDGYSRTNIPVIVNSLMCVSVNNKNKEETNKFIKYVLSNETQEKLAQLGHITGNKAANRNFTGINKSIVNHLYNANDNSIVFIYNLPGKIYDRVSVFINNILKGQYHGEEWVKIMELM